MKANLNEILCTIQGEGILVGTRQVLVRLSGCNLRCAYCDTSSTFQNEDFCQVHHAIGTQEKLEKIPNPLSAEKVSSIISTFNSTWISFTGGEPLLKADFIGEVISRLKDKGYKFLLETNGTLPAQLKKVIDLFDYISMDIKLPSTLLTKDNDYTKAQEEFLNIARIKPSYVKMVITSDYKENEITTALKMIEKVNPNIPLFIQPVTARPNEPSVNIFTCIALQDYAFNYLTDVRILPQIHPWLNLT